MTKLIDTQTVLRKSQTIGLLEYVCQSLELTEAQFKAAEAKYRAVGTWLSGAEPSLLQSASIYPQGSIALGTTVKPIASEEYDLDLVSLVALGGGCTPTVVKKLIGDRLRLSGNYRGILEEKPRCWRLNYANEFHLDITPSIPNPNCRRGGELVPDKKLSRWKPSNPKGYREWFERHALLQPRIAIEKSELAGLRAQVDDLPTPTRLRGLLRRCVQLCKRHRDVFFTKSPTDTAPISIIITTLATQSYRYCVAQGEFETELDVLVEVVKQMRRFIETTSRNGQPRWFIPNETTEGENFAEKWNQRPELAEAFYRWHPSAVAAFEQFSLMPGVDEVSKRLSAAFGDVGPRAVRQLMDTVSSAREASRLSILPSVGLATTLQRGTQIRSNTFFGATDLER